MVRVVVFQGPSGVGKTTLQHKLGIPRVVTWTTRHPREHEHDGVDYHFVDTKTFIDMCESQQMLEYTEYKSNFYGTGLTSILKKDGITRSVVLDFRGASRVKKLLNNECLVIGVYADENDCKERLSSRGDPAEIVKRRLQDYDLEISQLWKCDIILNNSTSNWVEVQQTLEWIRNGLKSH